MSATFVSSGCPRSAVYARTSSPWRESQATAVRVSSPREDATALRDALLAMHADAARGALDLGDAEEDVHMAVEAELGRRLGPVAGRLHAARSRNDQVALDLRMHVRAAAAATLGDVASL